MLRHVAEPAAARSLRRPTGTNKPFFQKHDSGGFPEAFKKVKIPETTGAERTSISTSTTPRASPRSVQMSALELHIWGSHIDKLEQADRIIFDIDPDEGLDFAATRQARDGYPRPAGANGRSRAFQWSPAARASTSSRHCRPRARMARR